MGEDSSSLAKTAISAQMAPRAALGALLAWRARHQGARLAYQWLPDEGGAAAAGDGPALTYAGLQGRVQAAIEALRSLSPPPDEGGAQPPRVLIGCPPGLDFVVAVFACLQAGWVAVPMPAPQPRDRARWQQVLADARPQAVFTRRADVPVLRAWLAALPAMRPAPALLPLDDLTAPAEGPWLEDEPAQPAPDAPALLQYTSGSTRTPRGVVVSHANLAHNLAQIETLFGHDASSRGLVWLPPFHDMGLIGGLLAPMFSGFPVSLMSPTAFVQRPQRWLQAISALRASTSGGPNFAYEHCLRLGGDALAAGLDLSCWRVAFVGAEPVRPATLRRFEQALAPAGFNPAAWLPCYGLAESTLLVSGAHGRPCSRTLDSAGLAQRRAEAAVPGRPATELCGCGAPQGVDLRVVDADRLQPLPDGQVGELWLRGPSVAAGVWQADAARANPFDARLPADPQPWLRSGDLGFVQDGEVFVTGRLRDLVVLRGANHAPQDLEHSAEEAAPALQRGGVAAFTAPDADGQPMLVLVAEVERQARHGLDAAALQATLRAALVRDHGLAPGALALVRPLSLARTPSGKLQRHRIAAAWAAGELALLPGSDGVPAPKPPAVSTAAAPAASAASATAPAAAVAASPAAASTAAPAALLAGADAEPLLAWLRDYASRHLDTRLMDERRSLNPGVVLDFGNRGLLGLLVPPRWGGPGLSQAGFLRVIGQLAAIDATLGLFVGLNNVLGVLPLLQAPTALQDQWLPQLAGGRVLAAFALSEAGAGSNPQALAAQAVPAPAGGWRLDGEKWWSGSAAWAGLTHVFVREFDAGGQALGISAFVLPRGRAGLEQGPEALTMGMRAMVQNRVRLRQVLVGDADRLGPPGAGMTLAQAAMNQGRLTIAAACIGGMQRCAQLMMRYAARRTVAGGRLLALPATRLRLGEVDAGIRLLQALVATLAARLDAGQPVPEAAYAVCKVLAPELFWQAADGLMQLLGGRGYMEPNTVPQLLRDARVLRIFEGPTETLAAHLGAQLRHRPQALLHELQALLPGADADADADVAGAAALDRLPALAARSPAERSVELGEALAWTLATALLQARRDVVGAGDAGDADDTGDGAALAWAQHRRDAAQALALRPADRWCGDAAALADQVQRHTADIGDLGIGTGAAGEDLQADPLLQPQTPAAGPATRPAWTPTTSSTASASADPATSAAGRTPPAPASIDAAEVEHWLRHWLAPRLGLAPAALDATQALAELGVDSVLAVELVQALEQHFALQDRLDPTLAWNHPTLQALAAHVSVRLSERVADVQRPAVAPTAAPAACTPAEPPFDHSSLDTLDDAELARLLAAELEGAGR